ncbi:MAG TPA: hypothetical protein VNE39_08685 [Planctomycetota bacterium]|nr:hypothetical protein [Planctomycetota bacterium]
MEKLAATGLVVLLAGVLLAAEAPREPLRISGIYPSLAALSGAKSECGIGAVVPWAGSLWFITYPAHYGDGKLYQVTPDLALVPRPESIGGTHAGRLVHRESRQLVIGPYFIDEKGGIRATKYHARITAVMRHLTDPANKVYMFDMEGGFAEVDVRTMQANELFKLQARGVTGTHGKGGYTGQGRVVVANNGRGGALAEWDGKADKWTLVEHKKFCEVTGPAGILGAPDDQSPDHPLWATGWDPRSLILKVLDKGTWHTYRYPKSTYTHEPDHGWFTEWPRIREVGGGRLLLDFPSMFYDFPAGFRPGKTAGFRPLATHLLMVPDFCDWNGRLVVASDQTSVMGNPLGGQPQSNLWFGSVADLARWGRPAGWGGPWAGDAVAAGAPSDPYLFDGFEHRVLHISHRAPAEVAFTIELDEAGDGTWKPYKTLKVAPTGYAWHIFPDELRAAWVRLTADADCVVSAYFHYSTSGHKSYDTKPFQSLAPVGDKAAHTDGMLIPHADRLWFLAEPVAADGERAEPRLCVLDKDAAIRPADASPAASQAKALLTKLRDYTYGFTFTHDDASVVVKAKAKTYRLPKADKAYDAAPWTRRLREVITERYLLNAHGTFYEVPREDFAGIRPISSHGKWISDFCTWRGLLVMSGALAAAKPDGNFVTSPDGIGIWLGCVDDLWQLGKPRGQGGPWLKTPVKPGLPSDPYLMTGFDKKTLELSHDAATEVSFTLEVDFLAKGVWRPYQTFKVPAGETVRHEFPAGYSAHWLRLAADKPCSATAWLVYE